MLKVKETSDCGRVKHWIDGIDLAKEIGVKGISEKQKANCARWFTGVIGGFKAGKDYYRHYVSIETAGSIAKQYLTRQKFKENAEKVLKEIDGLKEQYADTEMSQEPDLPEGTASTNFMCIYGDKRYWTAWGIGRFCKIPESDWSVEVRTRVSNALEKFIRNKEKCSLQDCKKCEWTRASNGVSAYSIDMWAKWVDKRLKRGDNIEGTFKKLLDGLYSIKEQIKDNNGNDIISWELYKRDTSDAPSKDVKSALREVPIREVKQEYSKPDSPIERVKNRLRGFSSAKNLSGIEKLVSETSNTSINEVKEMLDTALILLGNIKHRLESTEYGQCYTASPN